MELVATLNWIILLAAAALVAYIAVLHRRNSALRKQLETVNERLTHMQADLRRYLSAISRPGAEPIAPPSEPAPAPPKEREAAPQASLSILVADDNPELLSLMKELLESDGYAVTTAKTGIEAIEFITSGRPDIVLLDVLMPQMNGIELLQKMRDARLNIPVLIITAYNEVAELSRGFDNVKGVVLKPFSITDLLEPVNRLRREITSPKYAHNTG